jgi:hypothetical protein
VSFAPKNLREFRQRKSDLQRPLRNLDSIDCIFGINPIPRRTSLRLWQHSDSLVMPKRVGADSGSLRQGAGVKG